MPTTMENLDREDERMFEDIYRKAIADMKDALKRNAELLLMTMPKTNAATMLVTGALTELYTSFMEGSNKRLDRPDPEVGDYFNATAAVVAFEEHVAPIMATMRELVTKAKEQGGEIADAVVDVESKRGLLQRRD